jgi:glycosyltransferase involved in cell wall biosynthesis
MLATLARSPIRVLTYADSRLFSGAESFFCQVVGALARRPTLEVTAAAPAENEELSNALANVVSGEQPLAVPSQPIRLAALHLYNRGRIESVRRALVQCSSDVVLTNLPSAEYGATPLVAIRTSEVPVVGLLHVHHRFTDVDFRLGRLREHLARRAIQRARQLCVLTPSAAEMVRQFWAPAVGTSVVPLPQPHVGKVARAEARRRLSLPNTPIVGVVGRISFKQKGHDVLVHAAALLSQQNSAVGFAIAGTGPDEARLRALVQARGVASRFHFLGQVARIDDVLGAIDIIAIPSRFEGIPLTALEAIDVGKPGIASSVDGLRELWPQEWQVAPDDPVALASGLARLLADSPSDVAPALARARERMSKFVTEDLGAVFEPIIVEATGGEGTTAGRGDVAGQARLDASHPTRSG